MMKSLRQDWLSNVRNDLLAGIVVALALIPEAIAFSIIAGVDPKVGLYASFCIAMSLPSGGRPAWCLVPQAQWRCSWSHWSKIMACNTCWPPPFDWGAAISQAGSSSALMRFVSRSVITGFVNALAILIFMAQLPELTNVTWHVCHDGGRLGIIYGFPTSPSRVAAGRHCRVDCRGDLPRSRHPHRRRHGQLTGACLHCLMCR
jgi:SulP family sulfate permease